MITIIQKKLTKMKDGRLVLTIKSSDNKWHYMGSHRWEHDGHRWILTGQYPGTVKELLT